MRLKIFLFVATTVVVGLGLSGCIMTKAYTCKATTTMYGEPTDIFLAHPESAHHHYLHHQSSKDRHFHPPIVLVQ